MNTLSQTTRGILCMILTVMCFSSMDALAKLLTPELGTVQVVWSRYVGQTLIVLAITWPNRRTILRSKYPKIQAMRSVMQLCSTGLFFSSLAYIGLAEATALMDLNPVLITLGAALFLRESIGPRRMMGILVALAGALIVIRPGAAVFTPAALLPLMGAFSFAGYALATRFVGSSESIWTTMTYTGLFGTSVMTCLIPFNWTTPTALQLAGMAGVAILGTGGQLLIIKAFTLAEAAVVAPFVYVGIIFATFWGIVIFGEYPDTTTVIGALVIVTAGLYVWYRENKATHQTT
ncbi:DMT family transporter [Donghicola sp. C2-DW-16]|uniref:DMT family transporter n=1 Tax=Donghicola mangrovi TaxID=2729614 RepID=A0ABX2PE20_9RHOB|nr:DMT family transporter [Donghicola mangrovi]NVO27735.1 DMT family transporter [Donghicola mangrovi]